MPQDFILPTFTCNRCGHSWHPKKEQIPYRCGKCKSPTWNKPQKNGNGNGNGHKPKEN